MGLRIPELGVCARHHGVRHDEPAIAIANVGHGRALRHRARLQRGRLP